MCGSLKMKKNCMRSINFFAFIFLVGLFATSCHNNMITPVAGSLVVAVPGGRAASEDIANYKVDVTGTQEYTQTVEAGGVVTFSDVTPGPYTITVSGLDKEGKTVFIGTDTTTVEAGKSASVTIVLEVVSITITFESNGETTTKPFAYGVELPTPETLKFETTGYTFEGWTRDEGGTGEKVTTTDELTPDSDGKVTLYAQWKSIISGVLMWSVDDSYNYTGSIAPYGSYTSSSVSNISLSEPPVYCFDDAGNIYVQESSAEGNTVVKKYLYQEGGSYTADTNTISLPAEVNSFTYITYDIATKILYGIGYNTTTSHNTIYYYGSGVTESFAEVTNSGSELANSGSINGLAVNNGNLYILRAGVYKNDNGTPAIVFNRYSISSDGIVLNKEGDGIQLPDSFGTSPSYQMIFQDGALYLLLRRFNFENKFTSNGTVYNYSLGALVKINPNPDNFSIDTSFGTEGYLGLASNSTQTWKDVKGTYNDGNSGGTSNGTVKLTGPSATQEQTHFYGPVGFVAVMPKKLVIADSGFTFSSTESDGGTQILSLQKKSRIVTVDLETKAMDIDNVSGYYEDEYYLTQSTSGSYYSYIIAETETAQ